MATNSPVNIGGSRVKGGMQNTMGASTLLQTYTNTVLLTPDVELPPRIDQESDSTVVEDLPRHQATARSHATDYLDNVNPMMVSTLEDVIAFGNLWNAEYARLLDLAQHIDEGDNKETFEQGIDNLIRETEEEEAKTQPVIDALNAFLPQIQEDDRNFTDDLGHVDTALEGQEGEIQKLKDEIAALNERMTNDRTAIGIGAAGLVTGSLAILVGALAEFETAGLSTGLIIGGLVTDGFSGTAVGVAAADYSKTLKQYKELTKELAEDEQVHTLTQQAQETIKSLVDAVTQGVAAVNMLKNGWDSLQDDFGEVIDALGEADPDLGSWLVSQLQAANSDWQDTLELAHHLQDFGTLPVAQDSPLEKAA